MVGILQLAGKSKWKGWRAGNQTPLTELMPKDDYGRGLSVCSLTFTLTNTHRSMLDVKAEVEYVAV